MEIYKLTFSANRIFVLCFSRRVGRKMWFWEAPQHGGVMIQPTGSASKLRAHISELAH